MSTQAERPLTKAELAEREKELWANELEWQRQNPHPDLSDFQSLIEKEIRRQKLIRLPGLDIAMWPEAVDCSIDISNTEKFNERFIELPAQTRASGFEKWFIGAHNFFFLLIMGVRIYEDAPFWDYVVPYVFVAAVFLPLIYFFTFRLAGKGTSGGVRYNRQAQLVHIDDGQGHVAHIPWRQVIPFVSIGVAPASLMRLCAPQPHAQNAYYDVVAIGQDDAERARLHSLRELVGPYDVPVNMTETDHVIVWSNLQRLEFLRRYMADGIAAIQPSPKRVASGQLERPEDYGNPRNILAGGWDAKYLLYPLDRAFHYFTFGPWLDKRTRARAERFRWTQEVEDLCGLNPDLRGLDTRPIKPRTDVFYRPEGFTFTVLNRRGEPVSSTRLEKSTASYSSK
ncbi:hypothetical protein [Pseudomonas aeruginosa]|uniref:hypothetical protein n=1 Tax=Pseudomonas aeruginosa TaxID=287 RepID=UPI0015C55A51|nr:hypothetical protein [Pseudomonas aeruginosa]NPW38154.1 hypothetical protein [Pseudomonas aeruginosa]